LVYAKYKLDQTTKDPTKQSKPKVQNAVTAFYSVYRITPLHPINHVF